MVRQAASAVTGHASALDSKPPSPCGCGADHFVQFYQDDSYLVSSLAAYARKALGEGCAVLLIGTPDHQRGVRLELERTSCLAEGSEAGRFIQLDAAEMLARFMVDGRPDVELFERHVSALVEQLTRDGRRLCAFGEMVALLWAEGRADAALELERLWNDLARRHAFQLLCAYPLRGFVGSGKEREFLRVCESHGRVIPAESFVAPESSSDEQLRAIAILQQKAAALEAEIFERNRAEEKLRRREAQLTSFVETASIGLHWVDADGIIVWANPAELQLLGYTAQEYIGHHVRKFHADHPVIEAILACLSRGERLRDYEARLRCKDGSIKTVLIDSSVLWEDGRFVHTQCFTRDITEQRRAEATARQWSVIAESSDDAIFSLDLFGVVTSWNLGAERLFGYAKEEVIGRPTPLIPPDQRGEEESVMSRLQLGRRVGHYETVRRAKNGTLIDVSLTVSAVRNNAGMIVGISKIARDISEQKRADLVLKAAREELRAANASLEERVTDLRQLHELSWKVSGVKDLSAMLDEVMNGALAVNHTDKGMLSLVAADREGLALAASRGFAPEFIRTVQFVPAGVAACGLCYVKKDRVVIEDVQTDPIVASYRMALEQAGIRAVHSTPLLTREGKLLGVLSVHFAERRRPSDREMQLMDLYARHAADLIENAGLREQLRAELAHRTKTAEELRITTERFRLAAFGRTLTLFEQDTSLRYCWLYPEHPEHAGALGRTDDEILGAEGAAHITALKRAVLESGSTRHAEVVAALPTGERHYELTVFPKRDADGPIIGVAGAAFDITARKQAQEALRVAREETARINRELEHRVRERTASLTDLLTQMESFSYAVSHDLRSPLRAMAGYARVLRDDHASQLNEEGRQYLDRIIRASERMSVLISDVLAYARVNRGQVELVPVALSGCLTHVIQQAPELQAPRAEVIIRGELPQVVGSETFIIQVFANVLGNAVKFVAPGRKPRVEIVTEIRGRVVRVSIRDNGIGIKPENRGRLFGLFERLNVDKRYEGSGMGLAIVRRALERMGGSVAVESDGENGSCFLIDFPLALPEPCVAQQEPIAAAG